jgi:hypothetical protein
MRGGTLLALIQEKPTSIAGHGAEGERGGPDGDLNVGAAEGCDLLILSLKNKGQKIAACGSSYTGYVIRTG